MDGSLMMSSHTDLKPAKKVFLYKNGVTEAQPKCMVVNDRQIRDFSTFLNRATSGLRAPVAVRNIYTPAGGHKIKTLNDLESGRYYVAGGSEHFKKVKYGSETKRFLTRRQQRESLPPLPNRALTNVIVASARYKRPIEKPCVIHVFRNGDEKYRGARILIPRRMMGSWEYVLETVTEKSGVITPAKRLCTLDGQVLHSVSELQDGGKYVALEGTRSFQKVAYSATDDKKITFRGAASVPRTVHRLKKRLPPRPRAAKQTQEVKESKPPPIPTEVKQHRNVERRKSRPFGGRKNKEGREKAIEDHRADSIFGGSPTRAVTPLKPLEPVKASPVTHQEPEPLLTSAEDDVVEDLDTSLPAEDSLYHSTKEESIDKLPIDDTGDVEEILDEVSDADVIPKPQQVSAEEEGHHYGIANNQVLKELESQPVQNSIDLSLQRNRQPTPTNDSLVNVVSKKNSERSKTSSRKSSATASRPHSVGKLNPSQTHNILRTDSKPSLLQEPTNTEQFATLGEVGQTAVLSASGLESRHASTPMIAGNQEENTEETTERLAHLDETIKQTDQAPEQLIAEEVPEELELKPTTDEVIPDEPAEEIPEEPAEEIPEKPAKEIREEPAEEIPEEPAEEIPLEPTEIPEELTEEVPEEQVPKEVPKEVTEESAEEVPEESTDEVPEEPTEDIPQEPTEDISEEPDEDMPEATSEEAVPEETSESIDSAETNPKPMDNDAMLVIEDS